MMVGRLLPFLLILSLTVGCGSQSVITDPKEVRKLDGDEEREITFWNSYSDEETRLLEQVLIPAFERDNPNIHVKSLHFSNVNEFKNTLITRASSSRGPDVVRLDIAWIPEFSQNKLLQPLNRFPGFEEIRRRFRPDAMAIGFYQNDYYALPLNVYTKAAIFNRELLRRAGYSKPPDTMEEILNLASQHRFTVGLGGFEARNTLPYIYSLGGTFTNEGHSKATGYLNGEGTIRAVEQLLRLERDKIINFTVVNGGGDNWAGVLSGELFMIDEGPWFYSQYDDKGLSRALELTSPVPFPRSHNPSSIESGEHIVILKGSKLQNEAWTFLKWMTGKEAQLVMSKVGMFPTNLEAVNAQEVGSDSYMYPYKEGLSHAAPLPPVKNWSQIDEVYTRYLRQIFRGERTVQDGLDRAAAEIDKLLADSKPGP